MIAAIRFAVTRGVRRGTLNALKRSRLNKGNGMVQYAVTLKDGTWTVFNDGEPLADQLSRSAAVQLAKDLAFEAEARGEAVELLIQSYYGELSRRLTGGPED